MSTNHCPFLAGCFDNPEYAASIGAKAQKRVNEMYAMPKVWDNLCAIWKWSLEQ